MAGVVRYFVKMARSRSSLRMSTGVRTTAAVLIEFAPLSYILSFVNIGQALPFAPMMYLGFLFFFCFGILYVDSAYCHTTGLATYVADYKAGKSLKL